MTWTRPAYEAITSFVAAHTGLHFPASRHEQTELAIHRALKRCRSRSAEDYLEQLQDDAVALDDLIDELSVGETYFFREPEQFDFLRCEVLPELRRSRPPSHVFRVWSAGCATGEEAYSLAMLFEQEGLGDRVGVLATDISRSALERAQRAVYNDWSLRGQGVSVVGLYLAKQGRSFIVKDKIRRCITLEYLNLAQDSYPSLANNTYGMDLILCRNVLIYLDPKSVRGVAERLYRSLVPGGWLLTASSDPPLQNESRFTPIVRDAGVFYRRPLEEGSRGEGRGTREEKETMSSLAPRPSTLDPLAAVGEREPIVERVRKRAGENVADAERICAAAVDQQPLDTELCYLHAILLMDLGRDDQAIQALRRVIYLDRSLAVAHFTLGALLERRGERIGARAAYRNTIALCASRPAEEVVRLGDGECGGRLARAAQIQLDWLDTGAETKR